MLEHGVSGLHVLADLGSAFEFAFFQDALGLDGGDISCRDSVGKLIACELAWGLALGSASLATVGFNPCGSVSTESFSLGFFACCAVLEER